MKVKSMFKNITFLGCQNDRIEQMRKLAKMMALSLAEKAREEKLKDTGKEEKGKQNPKNSRNRSTMNPTVYPNRVPPASVSKQPTANGRFKS